MADELSKFTSFVAVEVQAAMTAPPDAEDGADSPRKCPTFTMVAYTGKPMQPGGFYNPVVVELSGVTTANDTIPILLNHDPMQIVGQGKLSISGGNLCVDGQIMGDTEDAEKVVCLAKDGFKWQASIGANITRREMLDAGKKMVVNGAEVTGPCVIARETQVSEVSFVAIGADQKTSAAVAASHSPGKVTHMEPQFKTWLEANGYSNVDTLSAQQLKPLEAAWKAEKGSAEPVESDVSTIVAKRRADNARRQQIAAMTQEFLDDNPALSAEGISNVELLAEEAVNEGWAAEKFEYKLLKACKPQAKVFRPGPRETNRVTGKVLEAAVCQAGRLQGHEDQFDDQTLQAAHDNFPNGIGLKQLILIAAQQNGYHTNFSGDVTIEAQRAAFGMIAPNVQRDIRASGGFSSVNISTTLSNVANKFLYRGWNAVDLTPLRIARIRPVKDFKQVTIAGISGDLTYSKVGTAGEIKHGTVIETTYTNQADTYARMLAITRQDIINDDLGALTDIPMKLGRGAALKLNDIFWTVFLNNSSFFTSGRNNVNTAVADQTVGGYAATETIFTNQVDPDGNPLGVRPAIVLVPTGSKAAALTLMNSQFTIAQGVTNTTSMQGNANIFQGRFRVESSPYMSNSAYTGYDATAWYMLADPDEMAVIEIAALNGRVEPVVQTADADFNVLGIQMRGYNDFGVSLQEYRAGVRADGGAS